MAHTSPPAARPKSEYVPRTRQGREKYRRIQKRFNELHEAKRLRSDDAVARIMDEFLIVSDVTIWRILRTEIPAED